MLKSIISSFVGSAVALIFVGGIGYATITGYIESKLIVLDRVETLINVSSEKIDKIFLAFETGVTNLDDTVTNSRVYERFFGPKEEN